MPDTVRTLAEINALFGDGTIPTNQDVRDLALSFLVHGVIGVLDNATTQAVTTSYGGIVFPTELHSRGVTTNLVTGTITTPTELTTAKYDLGWDLNFEGQGNPNAGPYDVAIFINGTTKIGATERTIEINGAKWTQSYCRVPGVSLANGDELQLAIKSRTGNKDVLIVNGQLSCQRLGVE